MNRSNYIVNELVRKGMQIDIDQHVFSKRGFDLETDIHVHVHQAGVHA